MSQKFKDRLADPRVWPISSTNLLKAKINNAYLQVSHFKGLAAALTAFLFRVSGWSRASETLIVASHYHDIGHKTLEGRLKNVEAESAQERAKLQQEVQQRRNQFDADWGQRGQKRRELLENLHNAALQAKQEFLQTLQPGGKIEANERAKIEALSSLDDAKQYADSMAGRVQAATLEKWRQVSGHFQVRCLELLAPFLSAAEAASVFQNAQNVGQPIVSGRAIPFSENNFDRYRAAYSGAAMTAGVGYAAVSAVTMILSVSFPPAAFAGIIYAAFLGGAHGWKAAAARQLKEAQQELLRHLSQLIQQARGHFLDVNCTNGRFGLVDEFFSTHERELEKKIGELTSQKLMEMQGEISRLQAAGKLADAPRQAKAGQFRNELAEWDALSQTIRQIETELQDMEQRAAASVP